MPIYTPPKTVIAGTNISVVDTSTSATVSVANVGSPNGIASLDGGGKVPITQLPSSIMEYKGTWNATTNTPTLADGTGDTGDTYRINVGGTQNLGSGSITFDVGDYVIYNGTIWQKSDTTDAVASVNSLTGNVVLTTANIADSTDKRYVTDAQQTVINNTSGVNTGDQFLFGSVQPFNTFNTAISPSSTLPIVADSVNDTLYIYGGTNISLISDPVTDSLTISTVGRATLLGATNYYVDTATGDDTTGTGSPVSPWKTIQRACNEVAGVDCNAKQVTINVAAGTYNEFVVLPNCVGVATAGQMRIIGDISNPSNVTVSGFNATNIAHNWNLNGFRVGTGSGAALQVNGGAIQWNNLDFASVGASGTHMSLSGAGKIIFGGTGYTISGNAAAHINAIGLSFCNMSNAAINIVGTLTMTNYIICNYLSLAWLHASSWTGTGITSSGPRYSLSSCSVVFVNNANPNTYLAKAGSVAGTTATNAVIF